MTSLRHLEARLRAWRSFRDIATAARTLAATQSLRWSTRVQQSAGHLAWCDVLAGQLGPPPAGPRPAIVLGLGTDLGLCGRLNHLVAAAFTAACAERRPALSLVVGQRLGVELRAGAELVVLSAPPAFAALQSLVGELERLFRGVGEASQIDLTIVLAGETLASGAPAIAAWTGAPALPGRAAVAASTAGPRVELTPRRLLADTAAGLLLHARLAHALCVAQASEAAARQQAMSRAVEQSERRIAEQEQQVRKLHKEVITQEMLEVLGARPRAPAPELTSSGGPCTTS